MAVSATAVARIWKGDGYRLFLSHKSEDKPEVIQQITDKLGGDPGSGSGYDYICGDQVGSTWSGHPLYFEFDDRNPDKYLFVGEYGFEGPRLTQFDTLLIGRFRISRFALGPPQNRWIVSPKSGSDKIDNFTLISEIEHLISLQGATRTPNGQAYYFGLGSINQTWPRQSLSGQMEYA